MEKLKSTQQAIQDANAEQESRGAQLEKQLAEIRKQQKEVQTLEHGGEEAAGGVAVAQTDYRGRDGATKRD